ncbi:hypothetical protein R1sor_009043 [Riccia sorocarpa]|uniref:Endonuclease/exonuclease/phosphatase domain-containing protein n=1 Tax=Riccia sorocarpa TaxID=122646 RepID=A0ABD3H8L2_9MARC
MMDFVQAVERECSEEMDGIEGRVKEVAEVRRFGRGPKKKSNSREVKCAGSGEHGIIGATTSNPALRIRHGSVEKRKVLGGISLNGSKSQTRSEESMGEFDTLKRERFRLENGLSQNVAGRGTIVFDKPRGQKRGTALLLHESMTVVDSGTGGSVRIAWARMKWGEETVGVMSIYAPNKRRKRVEFWRQIKEIMGTEKWCVLGDFNNVEVAEDLKGKSAVIKGREERTWRQMAVETGLIDAFFYTASLEGPKYTRMAKRRNRLDLSRLDRVYFSLGATWIDHIRSLKHCGASVLSVICR